MLSHCEVTLNNGKSFYFGENWYQSPFSKVEINVSYYLITKPATFSHLVMESENQCFSIPLATCYVEVTKLKTFADILLSMETNYQTAAFNVSLQEENKMMRQDNSNTNRIWSISLEKIRKDFLTQCKNKEITCFDSAGWKEKDFSSVKPYDDQSTFKKALHVSFWMSEHENTKSQPSTSMLIYSYSNRINGECFNISSHDVRELAEQFEKIHAQKIEELKTSAPVIIKEYEQAKKDHLYITKDFKHLRFFIMNNPTLFAPKVTQNLNIESHSKGYKA